MLNETRPPEAKEYEQLLLPDYYYRISMNPGLEPILLDLEKLFLLSDDGNPEK